MWAFVRKPEPHLTHRLALPKVGHMVEAVLSDIDGTLVESNWLHAAAWRDAFAVIDIPLDIGKRVVFLSITHNSLISCGY
jgi:hypothetical protein